MIFGKQTARMVSHKQFSLEKLAPRARFELATLRLTAGECKTLNALFGVAYDRDHLKSRPSVGQLLGNLLKRLKAAGIEHDPISLSLAIVPRCDRLPNPSADSAD